MNEPERLDVGPINTVLRTGGQDMVVETAVLANRLFRIDAVESGLLPPAVRWVSPTGTAVIFERPPFNARINFYPAKVYEIRDDHKAKVFTVPIPWTVMLLHFDGAGLENLTSLFIYARPAPITTPDDQLYYTGLPNLDLGHQACLGSRVYALWQQRRMELQNPTLTDAIAHFSGWFWDAGFNYDMHVSPTTLPTDAPAQPCPCHPDSTGGSDADAYLTWLAGHDLDTVLDIAWKPIIEDYEQPSTKALTVAKLMARNMGVQSRLSPLAWLAKFAHN